MNTVIKVVLSSLQSRQFIMIRTCALRLVKVTTRHSTENIFTFLESVNTVWLKIVKAAQMPSKCQMIQNVPISKIVVDQFTSTLEKQSSR